MLNRRNFIKGVGSVWALSVCGQSIAASEKKLRIALIGCGWQGRTHLPDACTEKVVALVDPDSTMIESAFAKIKETAPETDLGKIRTFSDYRKLYDDMGKELDAVIIATPNHHHGLAAILAARLGIHVYVEKPLTLTIEEARQLTEEVNRNGVVSQLGHHGHSCEGVRRLCEYIWAGAIGQVRQVYCWSDRANGLPGGGRPATVPVPDDLDWDNWIGPAPFRDFHPELHPHAWHRWCDFGNGSIGNMGTHIIDPAYWSLKLQSPVSVQVEDMRGGSDEYYSVGTRIRWDFPAREGMDPVELYWYDGLAEGQTYNKDTVRGIDLVTREAQNRPPIVDELEKKYNRNFGGNGSIFVGDKGYINIGPFGEGFRIVPEEAHRAFSPPPKTLPRIKGTHQQDFLQACHNGTQACANFNYSLPLSEIVLLGDVAMRAGAGKLVEWDGSGMRCTNLPEANKYLKTTYREGWSI